MVVGAFPIAKLSVLLIKQISKPIANICKERAKHHPFFRTYVCMPPAQFYNWCEVKSKMWILNLGKPVNIPVLSQETAIELGANLLGEFVIFAIGSALLIFEYNRQSKKEAAKEAKRESEYEHVNTTINELYFNVQEQQTRLREMERIIVSMGGKVPTTPLPDIKAPPETSPKEPKVKPPSSSGPTAPLPPQNMVHESNKTPTPYPNNGIILQSLNYIQMDVFSSVFPRQSQSEQIEKEEKLPMKQRRESALLSETLYDIENNFRSLF